MPKRQNPNKRFMLRCFPTAVIGLRTGEVAFSCLPVAVLQLLAGEVALRPSETSPMSELRTLRAGTVAVDGACKARRKVIHPMLWFSLRPSQPSQVGLPARFALGHLCLLAQPPEKLHSFQLPLPCLDFVPAGWAVECNALLPPVHRSWLEMHPWWKPCTAHGGVFKSFASSESEIPG